MIGNACIVTKAYYRLQSSSSNQSSPRKKLSIQLHAETKMICQRGKKNEGKKMPHESPVNYHRRPPGDFYRLGEKVAVSFIEV